MFFGKFNKDFLECHTNKYFQLHVRPTDTRGVRGISPYVCIIFDNHHVPEMLFETFAANPLTAKQKVPEQSMQRVSDDALGLRLDRGSD